jgi:hypothetical protein
MCVCVYMRLSGYCAAAVDISNIDVLVKIAHSVGVTGAREYLQSKKDEVSTTALPHSCETSSAKVAGNDCADTVAPTR